MIRGSTFFAAILLCIGLLIAGCGGKGVTGPSDTPGPYDIWMEGIEFVPSTKAISVGTTITWTNKDPVTHTVTSGTRASPDGKFDSGDLGPSASFSHMFTEPGTYHFFCAFHSNMSGTITVQ